MSGSLQRRCGLAFLVAIFVGIGISTRPLLAQQPASLPDNWKSLPAPDFVTAIAPYYDPVPENVLAGVSIDDDAVRTQASALIANVDFANSQLDYSTLDMLHMLASPKLADADQTRIKNSVLARQDDWTGHSYAELHSKWNLTYRLKLPDIQRIQDGRRWAQAGGQLANVAPPDLWEGYLYFTPAVPQMIDASFAVHWEGQVTAPQSGAYTFSVSPINVNTQNLDHPLRVSTTVSVGGNVVLTANRDQWTRTSAPMNLTANQAVPIAVDWSAQVGPQLHTRLLHALLSWQGPGIANAIVPTSSLTLPDGSAPGLKATYTWTDGGGQQQTLSRIEPKIDAAWTSQPIWLVPETQPAAQAAAQFVQATTNADFLAQLASVSGPVRSSQLHPVLQEADGTAQLLTSAQRKTFLDLLQSQPALTDAVTARNMVRFFGAYRIGNPDAALQVVGAWASRHADIQCAMPSGAVFDADARTGYRHLAKYMIRQMPEQTDQLQIQFLQTQDGRCSLPVAYTLAYANLGQKKIVNWISYLDSQLQNSNLTGDQRVNWLLARAMAEEISQAAPQLSFTTHVETRIMDGKAFLDQAVQSAQTPAARLRVALELAGRLMTVQQYDAATSALQQATNGATADQQAVLAAWTNQIAARQAAQASTAANQDAAAKQAYLSTLRTRRDQASAKGNTAAVNRYNAIINALAGQ